jgi:DNA-directed RNA polymerase I, II, and III subunit RPABC5
MKPIRCYTCGKILGNKWITIDKMLNEKKTYPEIYEYLNITRYCCKRIVMTSVDIFELENKEYKLPENIKIHDVNENENFLKIL